MDLVDPYKIKHKGKKEYLFTFHLVAMIDPTTRWFKMKQIDNKQVITVANISEKLG